MALGNSLVIALLALFPQLSKWTHLKFPLEKSLFVIMLTEKRDGTFDVTKGGVALVTKFTIAYITKKCARIKWTISLHSIGKSGIFGF